MKNEKWENGHGTRLLLTVVLEGMEGSVLNWLRKIFRPPSPKSRVRVAVDAEGVGCTHPDG
jgi:hypothetical protein